MKSKKEQIVELSGYTIECQSPLEITDGEGNFASNAFADIILDYRYNECLNAVIDHIIEKWHETPSSSFDDLLLQLGMSIEEYKMFVTAVFIPIRLREKLEDIFLKEPKKYIDYI